MKIITTIISALICLLPFTAIARQPKTPSYTKMATDIRMTVAKSMEQKHQMQLIGMGGGMMDCVNMMGLSFQICRALTKDEAKAIIVDVVQNLLEETNKHEAIRPNLAVYPFDAKHLEINLFINKQPNGDRFYDPDLGVASLFMGKITYLTNNPDTTIAQYKSEESELFEDNIKILGNESLVNQQITHKIQSQAFQKSSHPYRSHVAIETGCTDTNVALEQTPKEIRSHMIYLALAPVTYTNEQLCLKVWQYANNKERTLLSKKNPNLTERDFAFGDPLFIDVIKKYGRDVQEMREKQNQNN